MDKLKTDFINDAENKYWILAQSTILRETFCNHAILCVISLEKIRSIIEILSGP